MPKVRLQKELENIKRESEAAFQIREEFVRWDNVKTAHDLVDDMEVARMLLDCYDLIGGNFLVWSDQAKLAPPPLHATLFLQHVSEEGWEVLQEIKALGGWRQDKDKDKTEPEQRKSKRKQARVRHIEPVQVKQEVVDPEDGEDRDSQDDDYVPSGDDDDDFVPEEEDIQPKRLTKMIRKPKSRPDRGKKATKKKVAQVEAQESDDDATEDEEKDEEEETSPQPAQRKRGRPKKREVRPPPPPRKSKKKKPKPEEQETTERLGKKARTYRIFECKECSTICDSTAEFHEHFKIHGKMKGNVAQNAYFFYRCKPCDVILKQEEIEPHRSKHYTMMESTVCDTCGIVFTKRLAWKKHMMKHNAEKTGEWLICKLCDKTFYESQRLLIHMKRHTKERPHVCEVCGKGFKTRTVFDRHKYTHSDVKPYTCEHCGKGFLSRFNLKGHQRTHTGEKPFQCDTCGAAFTHNVSLKTHKKSAHGVDMWKDQKPNAVQEYEDVDLKDPEAFKKRKAKASTEEDASTSQSHQPEQPSARPSDGIIPNIGKNQYRIW
ncbi:uncharacterized protein [Amphiura filiformis]|uniref:uncharacterized protein isoform X12 n=1 Tax=Amphiura filiformis TaxID=82378 RepID=UPI003B20D7F0